MPKLAEGPNPYLHVVANWSGPAVAIPVVGWFLALVYLFKRKDWLSLLLGVCLVLYLTPLNAAFSLFTSYTYVRWGYALCMFAILATLNLVRGGDYTRKDLRWYLLAATICIAAYYAANAVWFLKRGLTLDEFLYEADWPRNLYILFLFALSIACLYAFVKTRRVAVLVGGIIICVCFQFPASTASREISTCKEDAWLADIDSVHQVIFIDIERRNDKAPFVYRTDFDSGKATNLPFLTNRPGTSGYSSCVNSAVIPLILSADTARNSIHSMFTPTCNRTSFDALMSVKQIRRYYRNPLQKVFKPAPIEGTRLVRHGQNVDIYEFKHYIPMGFTYDHYADQNLIYRMDTAKATGKDIPLQMLATLWVEDKDTALAARYMARSGWTEGLSIDSVCRERRKQVCDRFEGDTHGFSAHVHMQRANLLFFSVPTDPGFKATVDGKPTPILKVNLGLSAIPVGKGAHHIRFEYFPVGLKEGCAVSLLFLVLTLFIFSRERRRLSD